MLHKPKVQIMKKINFSEIIRLIFSFSVVLFFCSTCTHDDEPIPDYEGKWLTEKTIAVSSGFTKSNYTLEITNNQFIETFFEDVYQYRRPGSGTFVSIEGFISVSGNTMKFTPSKISLSSFDLGTSVLSAPYKVYSKGDQDFQTIFNSLDWPTCKYQAELSISNDILTLKADKDKDGLFTGFDETTTYTKQAVLEVKVPAF